MTKTKFNKEAMSETLILKFRKSVETDLYELEIESEDEAVFQTVKGKISFSGEPREKNFFDSGVYSDFVY